MVGLGKEYLSHAIINAVHFPVEAHQQYGQQSNNMLTPVSKKRPLEEKEPDYVFAKPVSVAPTPRKTKRQSPGEEMFTCTRVHL